MNMIEILLLLAVVGFGNKYAGEPFQLGFSARSAALGSADALFSEGATAVASNPAGLSSFPKKWNFILTHTELFSGALRTDFLAVAKKHDDWRFGAALYLISTSDIKETDTLADSIVQTGSFGYSFRTLFVGAAKKSFGLTIKVISQDLGRAKGVGIGLDLGCRKSLGKVMLSVSAHDVTTTPVKWSTGKTEFIMPTLYLGSKLRISEKLTVGAELETHFEHMKLGSSFSTGLLSIDPHLGAEAEVHRNVVLRVGFNRSALSFGIGLRISGFGLHYAYLSHSVLGASHRVSLTGSL